MTIGKIAFGPNSEGEMDKAQSPAGDNMTDLELELYNLRQQNVAHARKTIEQADEIQALKVKLRELETQVDRSIDINLKLSRRSSLLDVALRLLQDARGKAEFVARVNKLFMDVENLKTKADERT